MDTVIYYHYIYEFIKWMRRIGLIRAMFTLNLNLWLMVIARTSEMCWIMIRFCC